MGTGCQARLPALVLVRVSDMAWTMRHEFGKTLKMAAAAYNPDEVALSMLIVGDPGSGKSSIYKLFYKSASWLEQSGVLLDVSGEMGPHLRLHGKPGASVLEVDPFVEGGVGIDIAKALVTNQQWQSFSNKLSPDIGGDKNPFFSKGARWVIVNTLRALNYLAGSSWTFADLIKIMMNRHLFSAIVEQCPGCIDIFATTAGSDGGRDLAATVMTVAAQFAPYAAANDECKIQVNPFWALEGRNRWMVLVREPKAAAAVEATHAFLLDIISEEANSYMGKKDVFHIGADEFRNYQMMEKISEGIRIGRKSKVITTLTLHDVNGCYARYSELIGKELLDLCAYKVFTRISSLDTAEWASRIMGEPWSLVRIRRKMFDPDSDQLNVTYTRNVTVDEIRSLPLASWEKNQIKGYLAFPGLKCPFELRYREHVECPERARMYKPANVQLLQAMDSARLSELNVKITEKVQKAIKEKSDGAS